MSDPEPIPAPAKAKAPKTPRQQMSRGVLAALLVIIFICSLPFLLFAVPDWWATLFPRSAFERMLGEPIPDSVVVHKRWGRCALARTDEWLLFSASSNDMQRIIQRNGFTAFGELGPGKEVPDINSTEYMERILALSPLCDNRVIYSGTLLRELDVCKTQGFTSHVRYALSTSSSMSSQVLHLDASGTRALYHRDR